MLLRDPMPFRELRICPTSRRHSRRQHQGRSRQKVMATVAQIEPQFTMPEEHYINEDYGIRSWLLTKDHKRIAILYLISSPFCFAIGGLMATMIRIHLLTPTGNLVSHDNYNKLFTLHGVMMVFFFLVPSIPATLGNFFMPLMVGAKDLAFPKINLLSWYIFMIGGAIVLYAMVAGGVDTGWTFYTPFSSVYSNTHVVTAIVGIFFGEFWLMFH